MIGGRLQCKNGKYLAKNILFCRFAQSGIACNTLKSMKLFFPGYVKNG
jgi:hypothetical protein